MLMLLCSAGTNWYIKKILFEVILYCLWGEKHPTVVICSSLSALHPLFSNWLWLVVTATKSPQLVFSCVPWFSVAGPNMQNSLLLSLAL